MIGCKQPIIALYFEFENELKFYNLEAWSSKILFHAQLNCWHFNIYEYDNF